MSKKSDVESRHLPRGRQHATSTFASDPCNIYTRGNSAIPPLFKPSRTCFKRPMVRDLSASPIKPASPQLEYLISSGVSDDCHGHFPELNHCPLLAPVPEACFDQLLRESSAASVVMLVRWATRFGLASARVCRRRHHPHPRHPPLFRSLP